MARTDNLPLSNGQREDALYEEIAVRQPRIRVVDILTGASSVTVDVDVTEVVAMRVLASDGTFDAVAESTHDLNDPTPNGTNPKQIDFTTGGAGGDYVLILYFI